MARRRARSLEQERPEGPHLDRLAADAERSSDVAPVAGEVLRLQEAGGNEAVTTMLAQREAAEAKDASPGAVSATLVMNEEIGVLPLMSFSRNGDDEYIVTVPSSAQDAILMQYAAAGKEVGNVRIS